MTAAKGAFVSELSLAQVVSLVGGFATASHA